jgi:hypothetical protein
VPTVSLADVSRACGNWPILPAVVGKRKLPVLLRVDSGMPCIYMPRSIFSVRSLQPSAISRSIFSLPRLQLCQGNVRLTALFVIQMDLDQEGLQSALVNLTIRVIDHRVLPPAAEAVYLSDASKPMVAPLGTRSILSAIHTVAGGYPHRELFTSKFKCKV